MNLLVLQGTLEQGLIYGLVALALLLSYRVLDIADLTVDGSFTLGAAVSAVLTIAGHPLLGIALAPFAGMLAGCATALLQTKCKIEPILAGIITMTALYSINLMVMGNKANLSLLRRATAFSLAQGVFGEAFGKLIFSALLALVVGSALWLFLRTPLGLAIRATGDNRAMVEASSINPALTTLVGLALANGLVALAGAQLAQYQQFTEINTGTGMVVIGLASLIIGEALVGKGGMGRRIAFAIGGSILYRIIIALALSANVSASNLKLVSAIIVALAISAGAIKAQLALSKQKRKAAAQYADLGTHH
ncbi:MAG: ABC transporter permease [Pygmaiobacter sp.]